MYQTPSTYAESTDFPNFCKDLATLNLTLATASLAMLRIVGNINFTVKSGPQASASNCNKIININCFFYKRINDLSLSIMTYHIFIYSPRAKISILSALKFRETAFFFQTFAKDIFLYFKFTIYLQSPTQTDLYKRQGSSV